MPLPTVDKLLLEIPLYEIFSISEDDGDYIFGLIFFMDAVDAFCPSCDKPTTFRGIQKLPTGIIKNQSTIFKTYTEYKTLLSFSKWLNKIHHVNLTCTRNTSHLMQASFYFTEDIMFKIGQYPSIADLSMPELRKYRKVLSSEKYKELNRAVGLFTHGVGIGAFTYLRRIFEDLIEEAHQKSLTDDDWNEETYQKSRMDEKINLLQAELPKFLVDNRKLYSILSKGIHELTEDNCLEYFPTVRLGIELILEEKLKDKIMQEKIQLAQKSLSQIHSDLSTE